MRKACNAPLLLAASLTLTAMLLIPVCEGTASVTTPLGNITGQDRGTVWEFLGIPFATQQRWTSPQPPTPFPGGSFDATTLPPPCVQWHDNQVIGVEDCLTLNIWRPAAAKRLPVLIWIYGGSFLEGSNAQPTYDGFNMVKAHQNVILVSMNYRLGPFGFLALPELVTPNSPSTGMYGIEDQRAAMQWVQQYIAYFGGNPDRVTLVGQSAGGLSVCIHSFSPLSQGLFSAVILEDGNCDIVARPQSTSLAFGTQFAQNLSCSSQGPSRLSCLLNTPTNVIMDASAAAYGTKAFGDRAPWQPCVDGLNLIRNPLETLALGLWHPTPVLIGVCKDTFSLFVSSLPSDLTQDAAVALISKMLYSPDLNAIRLGLVNLGVGASQTQYEQTLSSLLSYYKATYDPRQMVVRAGSDSSFLCGTRYMAQAFAQFTSSVYYYSFNYHPTTPPMPSWLGAYHGSEVPFVFGNPYLLYPNGSACPTCNWTASEYALSSIIQSYWVGFAVSAASPNGGRMIGNMPPVFWPPYNAIQDNTLQFDILSPTSLVQVTSNVSSVECSLFANVLFANGSLWPAYASPGNARAVLPAAVVVVPGVPGPQGPQGVSASPGEGYRTATVAISVIISIVIVLIACFVYRSYAQKTFGYRPVRSQELAWAAP